MQEKWKRLRICIVFGGCVRGAKCFCCPGGGGLRGLAKGCITSSVGSQKHRTTPGYYLNKFSVLEFSSDSTKMDKSSASPFSVGVFFLLFGRKTDLGHSHIHMQNAFADTLIFHVPFFVCFVFVLSLLVVRFIQVSPLLRWKLHIIIDTFSPYYTSIPSGLNALPGFGTFNVIVLSMAGWLDGGACECVCSSAITHTSTGKRIASNKMQPGL